MDKTGEKESLETIKGTDGGYSVFGFGCNGFSQILGGGNANKEVATLRSSSEDHDNPLNIDGVINSVVASWTTTFYLKENGRVSTMGWIPGTKQVGDQENLLLKNFVTDMCCSWMQLAFLTKEGNCLVWSDYTTPDSHPTEVENNGTKFQAIGCRESSCILITDSGQVGFTVQERAIEGSTQGDVLLFKPLAIDHQMTSVACGKEHALLLSVSGVVYSLGGGSRGQLGCGLTVKEQSPEVVTALEGIKIQLVAAGGWHSAAICESGGLYMWGWNESGQLGLAANHSDVDGSQSASEGQVQCQVVPVPLDIPDDLEILTVSCGSRHTAAVAGDGSVWTWGWGYYGQLGHDDRENRTRPVQVAALSELKHKPKTVSCGDWSTFVIIAK